ncbi:MAG: DUF938 domain-containing protein [Rhodobacteraceae bacterium]|nr:DUF938 domain-containing protein [Paracoccaceae bacterium]
MADQPTTGHSANFRKGKSDGRLLNATFERNIKPVTDGLLSFLGDAGGNALEIGSGTGQHVCAFSASIPNLTWTPSEPDAIHRASIDAWRKHLNSPARTAIGIDAAANWAGQAAVGQIAPLTLVHSMNVIHIAPFAVARGIITGAGQTLQGGGFLSFYGPFKEAGRHTGEGNRQFDQGLRADNPDWGVRDVIAVTKLAESHGLMFHDLIEMPSNNRLLVYRRG